MEYLEKIRINATVVVFHCQQTSRDLNAALKTKVKSDNTKLTLMSMRRDPEVRDDNKAFPDRIEWDKWLLQCRQRIRDIDNCILVWNAGIAVLKEEK